ncbi:MAG: FISUMP domain-containing protein [Bacteroidota bacterium]
MKTTILLLFFTIYLISCQNKSEKKDKRSADTIKQPLLSEIPICPTETFVDKRDKKNYSLITIGKQTWTCGIIEYKTNRGRMYRDHLYDWEAAIDACPQSFRIPSESDWHELFHHVYDSIIKKSSPQLIERLLGNAQNIHCNECKGKYRRTGLPPTFRLDLAIAKFDDFLKIKETRGDEMVIMFLFLERMGFCTSGSGFKYQGGTGVDDYSYFWSSSTDSSKDHKFVPIYTGQYCQGCGYKFSMPYNNNFGFNLKCVKAK